MKNKERQNIIYDFITSMKYANISFDSVKLSFEGKLNNYELLNLLPYVKNDSQFLLILSLMDLKKEFKKYESLINELNSESKLTEKNLYTFYLANSTLNLDDYVYCLFNIEKENDIFNCTSRIFKEGEINDLFFKIKSHNDFSKYNTNFQSFFRSVAISIIKTDYQESTLKDLLLIFINNDEFKNYKKDFEVRILMEYLKNNFKGIDEKTDKLINKIINKKDSIHFIPQLESIKNLNDISLKAKFNTFSEQTINNMFLFQSKKYINIIKEMLIKNNFTYSAIDSNVIKNNKRLNSFFIFSNELPLEERKGYIDSILSSHLSPNTILEIFDYSTVVPTYLYSEKERCEFFDLLIYMIEKNTNGCLKILRNNDLIIHKVLELNLPKDYIKNHEQYKNLCKINKDFENYFEQIIIYNKKILNNILSIYNNDLIPKQVSVQLNHEIITLSKNEMRENNSFIKKLREFYNNGIISPKYPLSLSDDLSIKITSYLLGYGKEKFENYNDVYEIVKNYDESKLNLLLKTFDINDIKELLIIDGNNDKKISKYVLENLYSIDEFGVFVNYLTNCENELEYEKNKLINQSEFEF